VFEVLCVKKQQKFKFVFEKVSHSDPFLLVYTSLCQKIASALQKGTECSTPAKALTKVRNRDVLASWHLLATLLHFFIHHNEFMQIVGAMQPLTGETFLTPLRNSLSAQVSSVDVTSECISLICRTLEDLAKTSGVFAMTPRQSSDPSTALSNHAEVLCNVIPLLQEKNRLFTAKLVDCETLSSQLKQENQQLLTQLESLREYERAQTLEANRIELKHSEIISGFKGQIEVMSASLLSCQLKYQELEEMHRKNVNNDFDNVSIFDRLTFVYRFLISNLNELWPMNHKL